MTPLILLREVIKLSYYIAPDTNVFLCSDVPLDPSYKNTLYFSGDGYQYEYFASKAGVLITDNSYQRVNNGVIRLAVSADQIYGYNYMMFQNGTFGTKWFYAFITNVTYINNNTSEIEYVIDDLQTWMFETELMPSFVIREHTDDDTIGSNIIPENVATGEYVANSYSELYTGVNDEWTGTQYTMTYSSLSTIVAICDTDPLDEKTNLIEAIQNYFGWGDVVNCTMYDGVVSGSWLFAYDTAPWNKPGIEEEYTISDALEALSEWVGNWTQDGKPEAVVSIYQCPTLNIQYDGSVQSHRKGVFLGYNQDSCSSNIFTLDGVSEGDALDGYVPKNNKLYTYPYCFCNIQNGNGENMTLRYEFSDNSDGSLTLTGYGTVAYPVQVVLKPTNYKGISGVNDGQSLVLNNFPVCSWNSEYYAAWFAQSTVPYMIRSTGSMITAGLGGAVTPVTGGGSYGSYTPGVSSYIGSSGSTALALSQSMLPATQANNGGYVNIPGNVSYGTIEGASPKLLNSGLNMTKQSINNVTGRLSDMYSASVHADIAGGTYNNGGVNCASHRQTFYGGRWSVNAQYAKRIDDFFSMFGYATNEVKVPNIQDGSGNYQMIRSQWYFIQTENCTVQGSLPSEARRHIQDIYDNGVTFWRNPNNVGRYDLSNNIVG